MIYRSLLIIFIAAISAGCSGLISSDISQQCSEMLAAAETDLDNAKAGGLSDAVSISKAAGLITAAAVQKQFEKYEGCVDKAQRARAFIADTVKK